MGEAEKTVNKTVKPGDFIDISINFTAPQEIGSFESYYRLFYD